MIIHFMMFSSAAKAKKAERPFYVFFLIPCAGGFFCYFTLRHLPTSTVEEM